MNWTQKEESVVDKLFEEKQLIAHTIGFCLHSAFPGIHEHQYGQDVYIALGTLRKELGLVSGMKPGDIDILIIPHNGKPMFNKTIAIEVKVVRPTINKPSKNASSMGVTQSKGLLRDGFPYVGLIHVVIPEPLPKNSHVNIPLKSFELDSHGELLNTGESVSFDYFPRSAAERQLGRIDSIILPSTISYKTLGLSIEENKICGLTCGDETIGEVNNNVSLDLLNDIEKLFNIKPEIFRHVRWLNES